MYVLKYEVYNNILIATKYRYRNILCFIRARASETNKYFKKRLNIYTINVFILFFACFQTIEYFIYSFGGPIFETRTCRKTHCPENRRDFNTINL